MFLILKSVINSKTEFSVFSIMRMKFEQELLEDKKEMFYFIAMDRTLFCLNQMAISLRF